MRDEPRKPIMQKQVYSKYGLIKTERIACYCPECGEMLNAGPNFQPKYCFQCGQRIDFNEIEWEKEKILGYIS